MASLIDMSNPTKSSAPTSPSGVKVWDLPTRLFHWSFALFVIVAYVSSEADGAAFWIHVYSGTILLGFVVFRAVWGVIGSRHAQFGDFVYGPGTVGDYARKLLMFRPPHVTGHNPIGGWMVLALLAVILLASLTGMMTREDGYVGPLSHIGGGAFGEEVHEGLGSFVIVLVAVHVLGVIVHGVIARENLIRAMITGMKRQPADAKGGGIGSVGVVRPVLALALGVAVVVYFLR